jgi:hypothetical protein
MAKRIWAKPKAREGRASGRERVSPDARFLAFELKPKPALSRRNQMKAEGFEKCI